MNRKRILIVDDELASARLLQRNLEQNGAYEVRVEQRPEDTVATAHAFRPDLILLDVLMPRMLGGDVAAALGADSILKEVPVIFLSAAASRPRAGQHEGIIGDCSFLSKPASTDEIVRCIETKLRSKESGLRGAKHNI